MKNVHVLPTKESVLGFRNNRYILRLDEPFTQDGNANPQHIYIISDEAIKTGEWCFEVHNNPDTKAPLNTPRFTDDEGNIWWLRKANCNDAADCKTTKKIVMSTDFNLIIDGVQSLNFKFLQWYVDNPCDYVEFEKETFYKNRLGLQPFPDETCKGSVINYNIILPKEQLKTSVEWQKIYKEVIVVDADGWDRKNYQYSWFEELITLEEYKKRRMYSTCMGLIDESEEMPSEQKPKQTEINKAAEEWFKLKKYNSAFPADKQSFIEGAMSEAAKAYWFSVFKNNGL